MVNINETWGIGGKEVGPPISSVIVAAPIVHIPAGNSYVGLSSDVKPSGADLSKGATFLESDTGNTFKWDGSTWTSIASGWTLDGATAKNTGPVELAGAVKITSGSPGAGKVLTSDALGAAVWALPAVGGWVDVGNTVRLTNINDKVGIGTSSPNAKLDVGGTPGAVVGGFASGNFHVTGQSADVNANAVITGHNMNGGNKQLWYFGSISSSDDNIAFINRQNADMSFWTNNTRKMTISPGGGVSIGTFAIAASAILELSSLSKALLVTRMVTAQRDALTAVDGMILYNTTTATLQGRVNGVWVNL